jgi:hypothetical protein
MGLAVIVTLAGGHGADNLPPAPPWKGASEALIARSDDPWITPSEETDFTETPSYDETIAYLTKYSPPQRREETKSAGSALPRFPRHSRLS